MAIVDNFAELNKACKKLFPRMFDNDSMSPHGVDINVKKCPKCHGSGSFTIPGARNKSIEIECDTCFGYGFTKVQR